MKLYLLIFIVLTIFILFYLNYTKIREKKCKKVYNLNNWFDKKIKHIKKNSINTKVDYKHITKETQRDFKIEIDIARQYHENNDGLNAIKYYNSIYDKYNYNYILLDVADIYYYGSFNTQPDIQKAKNYYSKFLKNANESTPIYFINDAYQKLDKINSNDIFSLYYNDLDKNYEPFIVKNETPEDLDEIIYEPILNDPQNVHDTNINNSISKIIDTLKLETNITYTFKDIVEAIGDKVDPKVLQHINSCNEIRYGLSLTQLLELVYNRMISKNIDTELLVSSLNSCIENNNIVCYVGCFNRIVDSLSIVDETVVLKSRDVVNREMMELCAKISSDNEGLSDKDMKILILNELKKVYVESEIMTQKELDSYVSVWIDHI